MKCVCWNNWHFSLCWTENRSSVSHHMARRGTWLHKGKQTRLFHYKTSTAHTERYQGNILSGTKNSRDMNQRNVTTFSHMNAHNSQSKRKAMKNECRQPMTKTPVFLSGGHKYSLFFSLYPSFPHQTKFWHCCPPATPTLHFLSIISLCLHHILTLICWLVPFCLLIRHTPQSWWPTQGSPLY